MKNFLPFAAAAFLCVALPLSLFSCSSDDDGDKDYESFDDVSEELFLNINTVSYVDKNGDVGHASFTRINGNTIKVNADGHITDIGKFHFQHDGSFKDSNGATVTLTRNEAGFIKSATYSSGESLASLRTTTEYTYYYISYPDLGGTWIGRIEVVKRDAEGKVIQTSTMRIGSRLFNGAISDLKILQTDAEGVEREDNYQYYYDDDEIFSWGILYYLPCAVEIDPFGIGVLGPLGLIGKGVSLPVSEYVLTTIPSLDFSAKKTTELTHEFSGVLPSKISGGTYTGTFQYKTIKSK